MPTCTVTPASWKIGSSSALTVETAVPVTVSHMTRSPVSHADTPESGAISSNTAVMMAQKLEMEVRMEERFTMLSRKGWKPMKTT